MDSASGELDGISEGETILVRSLVGEAERKVIGVSRQDDYVRVEFAPYQQPAPTDSNALRDQLKGETVEHATPPRLEDEGQSGG